MFYSFQSKSIGTDASLLLKIMFNETRNFFALHCFNLHPKIQADIVGRFFRSQA